MTDRSKQAKALVRAIAARTSVRPWDVTAEYVFTGKRYLIQWANGPTSDQMRALIGELLDTGRYPLMVGMPLELWRSTTPRAWAARAVAAVREGTVLWREAGRGAAWRRESGIRLSASIPPPDPGESRGRTCNGTVSYVKAVRRGQDGVLNGVGGGRYVAARSPAHRPR